MPGPVNEIWDTRNNMEADPSWAGGGQKRAMDVSSLYDTDPDQSEDMPGDEADADDALEPGAMSLSDAQLKALAVSSFNQGKEYQDRLRSVWKGAYDAFNSKHPSDSKYSGSRFRGRSRLYRPKTRATARKKQAEAAAALFSTSDVVIVSAQNDSVKEQQASAAIIQELLNFRLTRGNENASIPWFQISMGAHHSALMTGICGSKQYWDYATEDYPVPAQTVSTPNPVDPAGEPITVTIPATVAQKVKRDRPRVRLYPPEDIIRDPAGAWEDQAQDSSYVILRNPMSVADAYEFVTASNPKSPVQFHDGLTFNMISARAGQGTTDTNAQGTRAARESDSRDRYSDTSAAKEFQTVWLHEVFMRIEGRDWVFWTFSDHTIISNCVPVSDAYPEQGGSRPIVIGTGALEPFKIDPMSPVSAWQPLQQEINDVVNLRLDAVKQTIAPLAIVRRGRSVDVKAIQNRTADSVVYVQEDGDLRFDRPGDVGQSAYVEMERLNADFDDQAGNFSIGSVQTNRQLGDTVGGMKMMSANANALGEFDLRVWIETWVEPVLRQIVKLEQYYENDQNVLAIAADRAKLFQKFGQQQVTDDLLQEQITLTVNVGIGAADPLQSLQKFGMATEMVLKTLGPMAAQRAKQDEIINEVFGKAGYKNAAERFFNPEAQQDPRLMQAQKIIQQMQQAMAEMKKQLDDKSADRQAKIETAKISALTTLAAKEMDHQQGTTAAFRDAAIGAVAADADRNFQREQDQTAQGQERMRQMRDMLGMQRPPMAPPVLQ
ncbi:hypothetical protein [Aestuariivirga sp.]|uniref:portal protein n=1 Tax=Aestuariivirga sp. TaxID=2650926 RepID=UPI0039E3D766